MTTNTAALRGKRFSSWQVIGRTKSAGKAARVFVKCRHCGAGKRFRVRDLTTGSYKPCEHCFSPEAGLVKDIATNPHTSYSPAINTHKENA